jgi:hypothetical protein
MTDAEQYKAREEAAQAANRGESAWTSFEDWSWFGEGKEPVGLMSPSEAARAAWKAARQGMTAAVPSSPSVSLDAYAKLRSEIAALHRFDNGRDSVLLTDDLEAALDRVESERVRPRVQESETLFAAQHAIPEPEESR